MLLSVEYDENKEDVEIYCDKEGLQFLLKELKVLNDKGGHLHFMTPSWAGNELTEEKQSDDSILINHLKVLLKP